MLRNVPEDSRTPEVCLEAVRRGAALDLVPEELRTEALCLEAVRQTLHLLAAVPEGLRSPAVLATAGEEE